MLRTETVQKWPQICQADPLQSQVRRARRDTGHEGTHPELPGPQGGGLRPRATRPHQRPSLSRVLARVRPAPALRQEVLRGHQVLSQRAQMGQGQSTDPAGSLPAPDPNARPGRL